MKILKNGATHVKGPVICDCGCEFEFTPQEVHKQSPHTARRVVYCPECTEAIVVSFSQYRDSR